MPKQTNKKEFNFIDAVIAIERRKDLELCESEKERCGTYNICVYKIKNSGDEFIGKLRWSYWNKKGKFIAASADEKILYELNMSITIKREFSGYCDVNGEKICKGDIVVECNNRYAHGVIIFDEKIIFDVDFGEDGLGGRTFKGWMVSAWHDIRRQEIGIYKELKNGSDYEVVSNINKEKLEDGKLLVILSSGEKLLIHRADGEIDCPKCGGKYNQATLIEEIIFIERNVNTWGWKIHTC